MSEEPISVSVVIPAYNCARSIEAAIQSVQQQDYPATEIVVVDDGSSDNTLEVLNALTQAYPKLVVVGQDNGGPAKARNTGIRNAKGAWIAFLDADDRWLPNRLQRQVEIIRKHPEVRWLAGAHRRIRGNDARKIDLGISSVSPGIVDQGDGVYPSLPTLARRTSIWTGTVLVSAEAIEKVGPFAVNLYGCEDSDLWIRLALAYPHIGFVSEPIAEYYVAQSDSVTSTNARSVDPSRFDQFRRLIEYRDSQDDRESAKLVNEILDLKVEQCIDSLLRTGNTSIARKFLGELREKRLPRPSLKRRILAYFPERLAKPIRRVLLALLRRDTRRVV